MVARFTRTERALHWVNAGAFAALLATGLPLYLPSLAAQIANRPVVKALHLAAAVAWLLALGLVATLGDRQALLRTRREIERLDRDDALWLLRRRTPQGRLNAGQKLHAIVQAGFVVLFCISGTLLLVGERNTSLRLPSTIVLHDALTYLAVLLVVGHIYLATVARATRPALRGILLGTADGEGAVTSCKMERASTREANWTPLRTQGSGSGGCARGRLRGWRSGTRSDLATVLTSGSSARAAPLATR
ncbi:MAG: cytochrome b/b6 domain-containing protein [Actinomycetota bacterium]|nr:cytochrome b/b6 domain-containing protein [Actinomycetota bacterium]